MRKFGSFSCNYLKLQFLGEQYYENIKVKTHRLVRNDSTERSSAQDGEGKLKYRTLRHTIEKLTNR